MLKRGVKTEKGERFTLYIEEQDLSIEMSREELEELIKEAKELLDIKIEKEITTGDSRGI